MRLEEVYVMPFSADRIWPVIADFANLDWMPKGIAVTAVEGEGPGMTRTVLWEGSHVPRVHRLDFIDHKKMRFGYSLVNPAWDVKDFRIENTLTPIDETHSRITSVIVVTGALPEYAEEMASALKLMGQSWIDQLHLYLSRA